MSTFGGALWGGGLTATSSSPTGAYSISKILYHALRKARVTNGPQRIPSPDQILDAFFLFQALLQSWRARGWTILNVSRNLFDLVAGTDSYSIGPSSADFPWATRPAQIQFAGRVDAGSGVELPIDIYSIERWRDIPLKDIESLPFCILYEPTIPNGRLTCYPVPSQADQLALYLWDTSADPSVSTESIDLADGFLGAVITNLALDCVETFGTSDRFDAKAFDRLERSAKNAKTVLKQLSATSPELRSDVPGCQQRGGGRIDMRGLWG